MQLDPVWDGKEPLTEWPLVDWVVILRDESFQPIWSIPPRTSSALWARRIGTRFHEPHDDHRSFLRTKPVLVDYDRQKVLEGVWAQVAKRIGLLHEQHRASVTALLPLRASDQEASADDAIMELQSAQSALAALGRREALSLCAKSNKVKHKSKLWALHHRNHLAALPDELHPERLEAHKCRWCESWHVGYRA